MLWFFQKFNMCLIGGKTYCIDYFNTSNFLQQTIKSVYLQKNVSSLYFSVLSEVVSERWSLHVSGHSIEQFLSQNTVFGKPVNAFKYHINVRLKISNICLNLHWSFSLVDKICYMYLNSMAERRT